jgi:hypothetical protein
MKTLVLGLRPWGTSVGVEFGKAVARHRFSETQRY